MARVKLPADHAARIAFADVALEGLSVGDAFGETFFLSPERVEKHIANRMLAPPPWHITDDTMMAVGVVEVLERFGSVNQDALAETFANRYRRDPMRGYGGTAHRILQDIGQGVPWMQAAGRVFSGMGSFGNGGAMRVAPLGAYFADDLRQVVAQARASAQVTHFHPEGQAGAVAVAVAAAWALRHQRQGLKARQREFLWFVAEHTPEGDTRSGIEKAARLDEDASLEFAVSILGNGLQVSAPDTVPFALWCASHHLDNYEEALWLTVSGLGDRDTTCAIVGGIVALSAGVDSIPGAWLARREALPDD